MNSAPASPACQHPHVFDRDNPLAERNTRWALMLTVVMMVAEITGGWLFGSMALLADGWHMSSHAVALGLSVAAYVAARRLARDQRFTFGTWKIEVLGGYTSAILLVGVAVLMVWQSVERLVSPTAIHYDEALVVGAVGLVVNLVCAWLLRDGHHHHHHGNHHEHHDHHHGDHADAHEDLNLRAAYLHVVADAATSVLAIAALFGGKLWGVIWLDPVMGLVGAVLIAVWAVGLIQETGRGLLDADMDAPVVDEIREAIEEGPIPARLCDLHVWRVGPGRYACIVSLTTPSPDAQPEDFKKLLSMHEELVHLSIEVNRAQA